MSARPDPWPEPSVHEIFETRARRTPDTPAIIQSGHEPLSYAQLDRAANRLARRLRRGGVGPEVLVGLRGERSPRLVAGLLAVLKAGGGYLPLDPAYPAPLVEHMIAEAGIPLILTTGRCDLQIPDIHRIDLDEDGIVRPEEGTPNPGIRPTPENVATAIFTSGSTGIPKAVVLPHRALVARIRRAEPYYRERVTVCQRASFAVVGHVSDLLIPLALGATVVIADDETVRSPAAFARLIRAHRFAHLALVPSHLAALLESTEAVEALGSVERIVVSGETLSARHRSRFAERLPDIVLVDAYGLTEAGGLVASAKVGPKEPASTGHADPARMSIVDENMDDVPPGVAGQLCVRGPELARGYLGRPGETADTFVPDPRGAGGARMLLTGDLARIDAMGRIEILGRTDSQIKVRGYRTHPGEIEEAIELDPNVARALVRPDDSGTLRAYLVQAPGRVVDPGQLRRSLETRLPHFLIPASFDVLRELPTLPGGKVDLRALSNLRQENHSSRANPSGTPTEDELVRIWSEELHAPHVSTGDTFFDLGGDSLAGMRVLSRIAEIFGVELEFGDLDETLGEMARTIESHREDARQQL